MQVVSGPNGLSGPVLAAQLGAETNIYLLPLPVSMKPPSPSFNTSVSLNDSPKVEFLNQKINDCVILVSIAKVPSTAFCHTEFPEAMNEKAHFPSQHLVNDGISLYVLSWS